MGKLYGLIPAAGKGTRAKPYSDTVPKSMLEINGVPNLQRNVELLRDQLGITDVVIVIGHLGEVIRDYFGDGSTFGVNLHYVVNTELDRGLAWSILIGGMSIDDYFCVILSDECYVDSNHRDLKTADYRNALVTCFIKDVDEKELIKKNYAVELDGDRIKRLIEKPQTIINDILGCGTFVLSPVVLPLLSKAFLAAPDNYVEFVSFLDGLCAGGERINAFRLTGSYVNINDRDSLSLAKFHQRNHCFAKRSKSLLIYSEGSEQNVSFSIDRYRKVAALDRIYLIVPHDNELEAIARERDVEIIRCPPDCRLYGQKIRYAFDKADGDILILTEADYAFPAQDIDKLLAYLTEADMVVGTRTTRKMMERGTDLQGAVRLANVGVAKLMELMWWHFEGRFTDVGCTFRAVWKSSYRIIASDLHADGPEFSAEMIVEMLNKRMHVLEIPVNYRNVSRALNARYRNINTFFRFLRLLTVKRLKS